MSPRRSFGPDPYSLSSGSNVLTQHRYLATTKNPIDHKRTRHINVSYYFVRELITKGTLTLTYIPTNEIVTNRLIKVLTPAKFASFINILKLKDVDI